MKRAVCGILLVFFIASSAHAQNAGELQKQIDDHSAQIKALQAEIAGYQSQLNELGKQKNTLQGAISTLTISQKQLAAQISVTKNNIDSATLQIKQLSNQIGDAEATIAANKRAIATALQEMSIADSEPLIAQIMSAHTLSDAWQSAEETAQFNRALADDIASLHAAREELASNRDAVTKTQEKLVSYQKDLTLQKRSVDASKAAEQKLLQDTSNKESNYQKLIAQKKAAELSFEQELNSLQSQLNFIVHPNLLPKVGSGVLTWPFSVAFMQGCAAKAGALGNVLCITQYFGTTAFSTANPQVYNGAGHNGIDIGSPIGTPILAAAAGTVLGTGNTDAIRGCYSFGKWVMVKHPDGLSTLYAHLTEIDVSPGQAVGTGSLLGLSGMTGYATGPHLHFGVYATEGTKIMTLSAFRGAGGTPCANATMPVASRDAYLNPLSYL